MKFFSIAAVCLLATGANSLMLTHEKMHETTNEVNHEAYIPRPPSRPRHDDDAKSHNSNSYIMNMKEKAHEQEEHNNRVHEHPGWADYHEQRENH